MSELAEEAPVPEEISAGTLLRRVREGAGLHVAALAVSLKVPVRKLEALEADRLQDVGDAVFIRGLASSVCRSLKVDPKPILERLPPAVAPRLLADTDAINAPFRAPSDARPETWLDRARQPVPATVIALLVAAVVIYFVPVTHDKPARQVAVSTPVVAAVPAVAPVPVPAVPPDFPQPQFAVAAAQPIAASAVPAAASVLPAASNLILIRAKGESWVEVVDSKGTVAVRKLMAPGESAGAAGALPLQVTIGKADQIEVDVRGSRYDLRAVSRDNVARFEVR